MSDTDKKKKQRFFELDIEEAEARAKGHLVEILSLLNRNRLSDTAILMVAERVEEAHKEAMQSADSERRMRPETKDRKI